MRILAALAAAVALLTAHPALAQQVQPSTEPLEVPDFEPEDGQRPVLRLPTVPDFEPEPADREPILPGLKLPEAAEDGGIEAGVRIELREISLEGNTAFGDDELSDITERYVGRLVGYSDLRRLQDELTARYVAAGYLNSGAVIPRQRVQDGVLRVRIVEGTVVSIEIETDGRFREGYVRSRLEPVTRAPVNVYELEERLQLLQADPRIRRVDAAFVPAEERGQARLRVALTEAQPWRLNLEANNFSSPLVDEWRGVFGAGHRNITGWGDSLYGEYKLSKGLHDVSGTWAIPLTRWDTRFEIHTRHTWSEIEESPFDVLDLESRTQTYSLGLYQPVYRTPQTELELFVRGEWRRSKATILDRPLPVNSRDDGVNKVAPIRLGFDVTHRTSQRVIAARSMLSLGFDILGATRDSGDIPDSEYVAWLGQLQAAQRLPFLDAELVARGDLQLSDRPLVGIERIGIGGHYSVRGYRENQVVGDNGVVGSLELRFPVPVPRVGWLETRFEIAPFVDAGHVWNTDRSNPPDADLVSVGIGGRWRFNERLQMIVYWGKDLIDVDDIGDDDSLQEDGLHLGIRFSL